MNSLIGLKVGMTMFYDGAGKAWGATVVKCPCYVVGQKTNEKDGYSALVYGLGEKKEFRVNKPQLILKNKAGLKFYPNWLKEVGSSETTEVKLGQNIKAADVLNAGDLVKVTAKSKGKGFAGGVKRYRFEGGPRTHGQSDRERAPGSSGSGTTPGRLYRGKRMAGRMGSDKKSVRNIKVLKVIENQNEIWLGGPVPGARGSQVVIEKI